MHYPSVDASQHIDIVLDRREGCVEREETKRKEWEKHGDRNSPVSHSDIHNMDLPLV